jgi:uncharacterized damage-inducible protein DinB
MWFIVRLLKSVQFFSLFLNTFLKVKDILNMKSLIISYATYNEWANLQLIHCIQKLEPAKHHIKVESSFSSIYATLLHILGAESIWWQRLQDEPQNAWQLKDAGLSSSDVINGIVKQDKLWVQWVNGLNDEQLEKMVVYKNSKKEYFEQPLWQILLHVFNHTTYHRGQLVTMLRQLGISELPSTDYIHWARL